MLRGQGMENSIKNRFKNIEKSLRWCTGNERYWKIEDIKRIMELARDLYERGKVRTIKESYARFFESFGFIVYHSESMEQYVIEC